MRNNEYSIIPDVVAVMEPEKKLQKKRFSITGHLGAPRAKVIQMIQELGGIFDKSPVWGTHYLICNNDWTSKTPSIKFAKAKENGTQIITEAQFYKMIGWEG